MEVVARKPVQDSAIYEKALPLELLPYAYRSDEYLPVGTAFAIGTNRFVSAAHVLDGFIGSNFALTGLRDSTGRVYEIDQILKYSMPQDFVVFSLKDAPNIKPLEAERRPAVGQAVYAVGNALGQGVVVRDGLYTSDTPEEWKWVRFSAAASPGSSGGPLLDAKGRVIGVVRGASPNEKPELRGSDLAGTGWQRDGRAVGGPRHLLAADDDRFHRDALEPDRVPAAPAYRLCPAHSRHLQQPCRPVAQGTPAQQRR